MGIVSAPLVHRFLHKFHLQEREMNALASDYIRQIEESACLNSQTFLTGFKNNEIVGHVVRNHHPPLPVSCNEVERNERTCLDPCA